MTAGERQPPKDYRRNSRGEVTTAEFNRYLPFVRCVSCGTWVMADAAHSYVNCQRLRRMRYGS